MPAYKLAYCKSITGFTSALAYSIRESAGKFEDAGLAGAPGLLEEIPGQKRIEVEIFLSDPNEARTKLNAAAANLVLLGVGAAGASVTETLKNVVFNGAPSYSVPHIDAGGNVARCSIVGVAQWGGSDTWALMHTTA